MTLFEDIRKMLSSGEKNQNTAGKDLLAAAIADKSLTDLEIQTLTALKTDTDAKWSNQKKQEGFKEYVNKQLYAIHYKR